MTPASQVVALVPCLNAAAHIGSTVSALVSEKQIDAVVVIDDGSTDDSAGIAGRAGARVVTLFENHGKGVALTAGVEATPEATIYLLVDADTGATAAGAMPLLEPVRNGATDLTVGVLPSAGGRGGFGLVKNGAIRGIEQACGLRTRAPLSGQRAVRAQVLRRLRLDNRFGVEVGMTIDAVRSGARVEEVPVQMDHEHKGKSVAGFAHRGRQGRDVLRALWPRLIPPWARLVALMLVAAAVAAFCFFASQEQGKTAGRSVPAVASVQVYEVPGLRWDSQGKVPPGYAVGSVVTGRTDDANAVLRSGSRALGAKALAEVQVEQLDSRAAPDVESLLASAGQGRAVMVVGTSPPGDEALRPLIVAGGGIGGTLMSPSTHRAGLVDLTDVAPTVISMQGGQVPAELQGSVLRFDPSRTTSSQSQADANGQAHFFQSLNPVVIAVYTVVQVALAALVLGGRRGAWITRTALAVAAFPAATYLSYGLLPAHSVGLAAWSALTGALVAMIVAMSRLGTGEGVRALRRILAGSLLLLSADLVTGSSLQSGGVFGSSPLLGTRYYGLGNPATTLFLVAFAIWAVLHARSAASRSGAQRRIGVVGLGIALLIGLPGLGADAGGLLVAVALVLSLLMALGRGRLSLKALVSASVLGLAVAAVMAFLDQMRAPETQTHLGRFAQSIADGGPAVIGDFVRTRVELNLLGYGFPFTLAVVGLSLVLLLVLTSGRGGSLLPRGSAERTAVIAALATSFLLFLVNDSGIVVLALPAVFVVPLMVVMRSSKERTESLEVSVR